MWNPFPSGRHAVYSNDTLPRDLFDADGKTSKVNVVDTTGAGDAFAAGFLFEFARDKAQDIIACCEMGHRVAAVCVSRVSRLARASAERAALRSLSSHEHFNTAKIRCDFIIFTMLISTTAV